MKIIICLSSLASLLISMNIYADIDSCSMYSTDYNKPDCEMIRQLESLNRNTDDNNRQLRDINSKLSDIQSKLDAIQSKIDSK